MRLTAQQKRRKGGKTYPREGLARIEEAAEFLNYGRSTVYDMVNDERIRSVEVLGQKRISWAVLWAIHDGRSQELTEAGGEATPIPRLPSTCPSSVDRFEAIERSVAEILRTVESIERRYASVEAS